jgi:hypothetical protein
MSLPSIPADADIEIREALELALWRQLAGSRFTTSAESIRNLAEAILAAMRPGITNAATHLSAVQVANAQRATELAQQGAIRGRIEAQEMTVRARKAALSEVTDSFTAFRATRRHVWDRRHETALVDVIWATLLARIPDLLPADS